MAATQSDIKHLSAWIALQQIKGLGNAKLLALLQAFGTPESIFAQSIQQLKTIVAETIAIKIAEGIQAEQIEPTLTWHSKADNHIITLGDPHYPKRLLEINSPPAILYATGNPALLNKTSIAIVGSRNATTQGEKNAANFALDLTRQGLCIISGMALGIDGAAHSGALKGNGTTIAVVGTGLDIVYPAKHRELAHQIAARGLILSEFPIGMPSKPQNFPQRNRIISGLSLGCLVVEANVGSGSLITARLASEQGREVFAIPGSIHSPVSKGCHQLIKQGAKLVESSMDIMEELKNMLPSISPLGPTDQVSKNSPETSTLLGLMGYEAIKFDTLADLSGLTPEALSSMLILLELEGKISVLAGGQYQRLT